MIRGVASWSMGVAAVAVLLSCGPGPTPETPTSPNGAETPVEYGTSRDAFSSAESILVDFRFKGSLVINEYESYAGFESSNIRSQLLYTMGQLNGFRAVGRLDKLTVSGIQRETLEAGKVRISYDAILPVAWGDKSAPPSRFEFVLPKDVSYSALTDFTKKYNTTCIDRGAHDVEQGSMWYYYRTNDDRCALAPEDVIQLRAFASISVENTTGKFPEYDRVWRDGVLDIVAIFGKYEDGATTRSDAGIAAYNNFVRRMGASLAGATIFETTPAELPIAPGVDVPVVTFQATFADGRRAKVSILLVDNVISGSPDYDFESRYASLTESADVIMYNGHAGLGQNVRALSNKGRFVSGKYLLLFMNGCDTFAYVDGTLAQSRAALNPDDPTGSKYMDIVTNALPAYFHSMPSASLALINGLLSLEAPQTYEQMFAGIDQVQVVVVTGEEDNTFRTVVPAGIVLEPVLDEQVELLGPQQRAVVTVSLPAGSYVVSTVGNGEVDLAAHVGAEASFTEFSCSSANPTADEMCVFTVTQPGPVHLLLENHAPSSDVRLLVRQM